MDQREIDELRKQLESAGALPEKSVSLILLVLNRLVAHLESERESRVLLNEAMDTFKRQIEGYYDNGNRKSGIMERFDKIELAAQASKDEAMATRQEGKESQKLIRKLMFTVIGSLVTALILWGVGHIHIK